MRERRALLTSLVCTALALAASGVLAQAFPSKPIRIIVPFPAGELGFPGLEADGRNGLFAPAKMPRVVIDRLHREIVAAVKHPENVKRFGELAAEPVGSTPAEQDAILRRQVEQFRPVIKEMKLE